MRETPTVTNALPPDVFLGPTAPAQDVLSVLPDALVVPPCRRGDLYRYRIFKHSIFLIIDGVFGGSLAVSPREVVDVIDDGAVVIGASSMGALRAVDCYPKGALGIGIVYRLYRLRAISSEDEVAVTFRQDRPFPPLTDPLINMRVALRRAVRRGLMTAADSLSIVAAAEAKHYSDRTWSLAFRDAGVMPSMTAQQFLRWVDVKRQDANLAFRRVAEWLRMGCLLPAPPQYGVRLFGLLEEGRERAPDPLDGTTIDEIRADFLTWLTISGYIRKMQLPEASFTGSPETPYRMHEQAASLWEAVRNSVDFDAAIVQFNVFKRAVEEARRLGLSPNANDFEQADLELAEAHGAAGWTDLTASGSVSASDLLEQRYRLSLSKCLRRALFLPESVQQPSGHQPQWRRN